ncbi:unnamed protein product [Cylindrotheca closterium]|uniref:HSF-type DNA-binding domain-containing protein n=1 Tax=Cylindrotheca closterium TaxID=2856 RepID=A0AAD2GCU9_9STRA|nr:unnamed protein product [Cylindrotheca closterium]
MSVVQGTIHQAQMAAGEAPSKDSRPKKGYVYHDFAKISEEFHDYDKNEVNPYDHDHLLQVFDESTAMAADQALQQASTASFSSLPQPVQQAPGIVRAQRFPVKLYALLSQPRLSHIITWLPHGRSWRVLDTRAFETSVLPVFFESDNYHSFNRVINAWSFRRRSTGPDKGSYFHELFLRGKPHLHQYIRRIPRSHKKLAMTKKDEPDFYALEISSPLPTLEEEGAARDLRSLNHAKPQFERNQLKAEARTKRLVSHQSA